jgi:hypothetical protein
MKRPKHMKINLKKYEQNHLHNNSQDKSINYISLCLWTVVDPPLTSNFSYQLYFQKKCEKKREKKKHNHRIFIFTKKKQNIKFNNNPIVDSHDPSKFHYTEQLCLQAFLCSHFHHYNSLKPLILN